MVVQAHNPSFWAGGSRIMSSRPTWTIKQELIFKKKKRLGGGGGVDNSEFIITIINITNKTPKPLILSFPTSRSTVISMMKALSK